MTNTPSVPTDPARTGVGGGDERVEFCLTETAATGRGLFDGGGLLLVLVGFVIAHVMPLELSA